MLGIVKIAVLGIVLAAADASAFQAEVQRYYQAVGDICRTGITPEILRLYQEAARAVDKAEYGSGRGGNFWGLQTPENAWLACFQSPGWE